MKRCWKKQLGMALGAKAANAMKCCAGDNQNPFEDTDHAMPVWRACPSNLS